MRRRSLAVRWRALRAGLTGARRGQRREDGAASRGVCGALGGVAPEHGVVVAAPEHGEKVRRSHVRRALRDRESCGGCAVRRRVCGGGRFVGAVLGFGLFVGRPRGGGLELGGERVFGSGERGFFGGIGECGLRRAEVAHFGGPEKEPSAFPVAAAAAHDVAQLDHREARAAARFRCRLRYARRQTPRRRGRGVALGGHAQVLQLRGRAPQLRDGACVFREKTESE